MVIFARVFEKPTNTTFNSLGKNLPFWKEKTNTILWEKIPFFFLLFLSIDHSIPGTLPLLFQNIHSISDILH